MDYKKIAYIFGSVIILAIIVNLATRKDPESRHRDKTNRKADFIRQMSNEEWKEAGIDPSEINVTDIEMTDMIDEVVVEKNPVCSGEDFMVSVKASNPRGKTDTLNYRIAGKKGNPVILNYKAPGEKNIHVFVRGDVALLDHKTSPVRVVRCENKPAARLKSVFSDNRLSEVDFEVVDMQGLEGDCVFEWDFGNGKSAKTTIGAVNCNYGDREQKSFTSTFIAKVAIIDEKGVKVVARNEVTFPNIQWINSRMGSPAIPITYDRIARRNGDDYIVNIQIKNIFDTPLNFTDAHVKCVPCGGNQSAETSTYSAGEFISKTSLEAGEYAKDTLIFNKSICSFEICTVAVKLAGQLSDGREVVSSMYISVPMSPESIQEALQNNRARVISDGDIIDKVKKARVILSREFVTPEDIKRLERDGKL